MPINLLANKNKPINLLANKNLAQDPLDMQMSEGDSFLKKLPRNILIGLTHMGRDLHNLPHDVSKGFETGAEPFGKAFDQITIPGLNIDKGKPLSSYLPSDEASYADVFGQQDEGTLLDNLIQKGIEHVPEIAGGRALLKMGLRKYPITKKMGGRKLQEAESLINEAGIKTPINHELIEASRDYLPKTQATKEMLQSVAEGEYSPSFSLQSQLGHHERNLRNSSLAAERLLSPQVRELKQNILHDIEMQLRMVGRDDIADLMRGGIDDYRKYMKFKNDVVPVLKKYGIPTTGVALLGLGYPKAKKFINNLSEG